MSVDFDRLIPRDGTASVKHDGRKAFLGSDDVLPLWVADMDFAVPDAVRDALLARAAHPIYGYTQYPDGLYDAAIGWMARRHGWAIRRDWIVFTPGVVSALHAAVLAFAGPGDGVIVQPPVYHPFFSAVTGTGRRLLLNPLRLQKGRYTMDVEHLERLAEGGARLLLLCSPHNPVGRVWTADELNAVLAIARRHGLVVLADEIHHDLVFPEYRHHALGTLATDDDAVVTAAAPSKTFNIPGLGLSMLIIPNPQHRAAVTRTLELLHMGATNPFSIAAFEAAYAHGEPWLAALLDYLTQTRDLVRGFLRERLPEISLIEPEGTYLLWLDCRGLNLGDDELRRFFIQDAKVGLNPGTLFGADGSGFMRLNIGAPRSVIADALTRIERAVNARR